MSFQKILIAVDGSTVAAHAADVGIELARLLGGELGFVHAVDPSANYAPDSGIAAAALLAQAEQEGKGLLNDYHLRASFQRPSHEFLQVGRPATEIVKAAQEWPADLIVIGSHGRGGVTHVLIGSVAEGVMRHAHCPVLVVRAQK